MTSTAPCEDGFEAGRFEAVYAALRAQARRYLRAEQNAHSISPTVLVHEAWMTLAASNKLNISDSSHYVRLVSRVMKNLLIDRARHKKAAVHGGMMQRVDCDGPLPAAEADSDLILSIAAAVDDLAMHSPGLA